MIVVSNHSTSKTITVQRGLFIFHVLPMCVAAFQKIEPGGVWTVAWHSHHIHGRSAPGDMHNEPSSVLVAPVVGTQVTLPNDAKVGDTIWVPSGPVIEIHEGNQPLHDVRDRQVRNVHMSGGLLRYSPSNSWSEPSRWRAYASMALASFAREGGVEVGENIIQIRTDEEGYTLLILQESIAGWGVVPDVNYLYSVTGTAHNDRGMTGATVTSPTEVRMRQMDTEVEGGLGEVIGRLVRHGVGSRYTAQRYVQSALPNRLYHHVSCYPRMATIAHCEVVPRNIKGGLGIPVWDGWWGRMVVAFASPTPWTGYLDTVDQAWISGYPGAEEEVRCAYNMWVDNNAPDMPYIIQPIIQYGTEWEKIPWAGAFYGYFHQNRSEVSLDADIGYIVGDLLAGGTVISGSGAQYTVTGDATVFLGSKVVVYDHVRTGDDFSVNGLSTNIPAFGRLLDTGVNDPPYGDNLGIVT
jgi:hypothetical protein